MFMSRTLVLAALLLSLTGCFSAQETRPTPPREPVQPIEYERERDKPLTAMQLVEVPALDQELSGLPEDEQARQTLWLITRLYSSLAEANSKIGTLIGWIEED